MAVTWSSWVAAGDEDGKRGKLVVFVVEPSASSSAVSIFQRHLDYDWLFLCEYVNRTCSWSKGEGLPQQTCTYVRGKERCVCIFLR